VILLDADVILIDRKYVTDPRRGVNSTVLARLMTERQAIGMVAHAVLEVVGVMSHGTTEGDVPLIPDALRTVYGIAIVPDLGSMPDYAGCTHRELLLQMSTKMSLGDAVQAVQINKFLPSAEALLTWNAKHFRGKLAVPVLTPEEWLQQQPPAAPATPTP
jgi:hypothetical protein